MVKAMQVNRRQFLTGCTSFLAGLGILETIEPILNASQGAALGQSAPRKLALLVGVNQYQNRAKFPDLRGCVTDVEIIRNLLIHRFGFNPQDIHVLTNEAATRRTIELAFQAHLIDQAKSSDVVVFHFSGFGQYLLPGAASDPTSHEILTQYGLLPFDAVRPLEEGAESRPKLNVILQETLYLLIQSLKTDRVVTLLDTGFHYPGRANLEHSRVRSLPPGFLDEVNGAEVAIQDELLSHSKLKRSQLTEQRISTPPRGLVVTAASLQQFGIEADWQGFSAGALTYTLAQQLWHTAPSSSMAAQVSRAAEFLSQDFSLTQQPELVGQKKSTLTRDVIGLPNGLSGDGVILNTDSRGKSGDVWLGGVLPTLLKTDKTRMLFSILVSPPGGGEETLIKVNNRGGLLGTAQILGGGVMEAGNVVQERYRQIAKNQPLRLALSSRLEKVEKIDATSVFGGNGSLVKVVKDGQPADIVLSKLERRTKVEAPMNDEDAPDKTIATAETHTYFCLCNLAGDILPRTISDRPVAIKNHFEVFQGTFDILRWHQCLEQLINASTPDLSASAALETTDEAGSKTILLAKSTVAASKGPNTVPADVAPGRILTVNPESKFQIKLTNSGTDQLYAYILGCDAQPNAIMVYRVLFPNEDSNDQPVFQPFAIESGSDLVLPAEDEEFGIYGPSGIGSLYALLTRSPLPQFEQAINEATKSANKGTQPKQIKIPEPLPLREALLTDLAQISQTESDTEVLDNKNYWTLSVRTWAMIRFVYQVL